MLDTEPLRVEAAREFAAQHWPTHNRSQGFQWEQSDFALGAFDALECVGVAIYRVVGGMAHLAQLVVASGLTHRGIGSAGTSIASHCADRRGEHEAKDGKIAVR